ncbi:MAG: hypothetical protein Kow0040_12080 [Thermogutta sp.]
MSEGSPPVEGPNQYPVSMPPSEDGPQPASARSSGKKVRRPSPLDPFRIAVWRGLATVLPPLLTFVILIWIVTTINLYIFRPLRDGTRDLIFLYIADIKPAAAIPVESRGKPEVVLDGKSYTRLRGGKYIPKPIIEYLAAELGEEEIPSDARECYRTYIQLRYLKPHIIFPFLLAVLILVLYLLGKFVAARVGRMAWATVESAFFSFPLVKSIYGSVKQVSDFLLAQRQMEFSRVVAVEYPRRGIWSMGLVTGESLNEIRTAANEPILAVFIPTSPAPMTGFTVNVPKKDTIDLDISIDQAIQFIVSCGVVAPPQQLAHPVERPPEVPRTA